MKSRILTTLLAVLTAVAAHESSTEQTVKRYESNPPVIMDVKQNPFLTISQPATHVQEGIDSPQIITPAVSDSYIWQLEGIYAAEFSGPHSFSIGETQKAVISFGITPESSADMTVNYADAVPLSDKPLTFDLVQGKQYPVKIAYASGSGRVPIIVSVDGVTHDLSEVIRQVDASLPEAATESVGTDSKTALTDEERLDKEREEEERLDKEREEALRREIKELTDQTIAEQLAKNLAAEKLATDADKDKLDDLAAGASASGASASGASGSAPLAPNPLTAPESNLNGDGNDEMKKITENIDPRVNIGDGKAKLDNAESASGSVAAGGSPDGKDKTVSGNNEPLPGGSQGDGKLTPGTNDPPVTTPEVPTQQNGIDPGKPKKREVDDDVIVKPIGFEQVYKLSPEPGFKYVVFPAAHVTALEPALRDPTGLPVLGEGLLNKAFTGFVPSSKSAALAQEYTGFFSVPKSGSYKISLTDEPTTVFHFGPGAEKKASKYVMDNTWAGVDTRISPEGEFALETGVFYPYRLMMLLPSPDSKREVIVHGPEGELLDILGLWEKAPTAEEEKEQKKQNPAQTEESLEANKNTLQKEPETGGQQQNDDKLLKGDASLVPIASGDSKNTAPSQNGRDPNMSLEGAPKQDQLLKGDAAPESSAKGADGQKQTSETTLNTVEGGKNATLPVSSSPSPAKNPAQKRPHMSTNAQKGSNSLEVADPRSSLTRETSHGADSSAGKIVSVQGNSDVVGAAGIRGGASLRAQASLNGNTDISAEMKFDVKYSFSACVPGTVCVSPVSPNLIHTGKDVVQDSPKPQRSAPGSKNVDGGPGSGREPSVFPTALKSGARQPSSEHSGSGANANVNASAKASVKVEAKVSIGSGLGGDGKPFGGEPADKVADAVKAVPSPDAGKKSPVGEDGKGASTDSKQAPKPADSGKAQSSPSSKASEKTKPADAAAAGPSHKSSGSESTPAGKAQVQAPAKFVQTYEGGAPKSVAGLSFVLSLMLFVFV
ncbi:hypothetical protein OXX69_002722 [Metschnikowia pulcherrima]